MRYLSPTLSLIIGICFIVLTAHLVEELETKQELDKLKIEREELTIELLKLQHSELVKNKS